MNVNELSSVVYNQLANGLSSTQIEAIKNIPEISGLADSLESKEGFSDALNNEISKISEFSELASVLNKSVLGQITQNASMEDLAVLSEDLLGSSGGRDVLAKLMEGHFNQLAMTDSDDEDNEPFNKALDSFSQSVAESQELLSNLEAIMGNMKSSED